MLKAAENERLTRVGSGTPMGTVFRHYWFPICKSEELEAGGAPKAIQLLGDRMVAFRSPGGELGLLDEWCPHRAASLVLARNEECGLRCLYHGWAVDREGRLADVPTTANPERMQKVVKHGAYTVVERGGFVWAFVGDKEDAPQFPAFRWLDIPDTHAIRIKVRVRCNWAQAIEGLIDSAHAGILHQDLLKPSEDTDTSSWDGEGQARNTADFHPILEVEDRPYGFRYAALRDPMKDADKYRHVRTTLYMAPVYAFIASLQDRGDWMSYVPINDEESMMYIVHFSTKEALTDEYRDWYLGEWFSVVPGVDVVGDGVAVRGPENLWMQDRPAMTQGRAFSGIKGVFNEDAAVIESMGPVVDRTKEHLGSTDTAVVRFRRMMLRNSREVESGGKPIGIGTHIPYELLDAEEGLVPNDARWQDVLGDGLPEDEGRREDVHA